MELTLKPETPRTWTQVLKRKVLTDRQLWKAKFSTVLILCFVAYSIVMDQVAAQIREGNFIWKTGEFPKQLITDFKTGQIVQYETREDFCNSFILVPGFALQRPWFLTIVYIITLVYIFVGVSIISDIFMDSITVITSAKRIVQVRDVNANITNKTVLVWNSTVANLTLMALGSSAPEIMLNVLETVMTLGAKPGELGASTIVGSAAFNLLVISGVSIMAVTPESDDRTDEEIEEDQTEKGVKKIQKTKVFTVTTVFSILAYVWMYYCLMDEIVQPHEAWITLALFPILIIMALIADKCGDTKTETDKAAQLPVMNTAEFIAVLKDDRADDQMKPGELQRKSTLKTFLKTEMGNDNINEVNLAELKAKIEGDAIVKKGEFRKQGFSNMLQGKRPKIQKGEAFSNEANFASNLGKALRHPDFGFHTLNYTVSEACKHIKIKVLNKNAVACSVGIRTKDSTAKAGKDYNAIPESQQNLKFAANQDDCEILVEIIDDEQWNEDREFEVELFDLSSGLGFEQRDTKADVLIIDDDKPGNLTFENKKGQVRHVVTEQQCPVKILRVGGADGEISCKWKTIALQTTRAANPGEDFTEEEGIIKMAHAVSQVEIMINIPARPADEKFEVKMFGVQLSQPFPRATKIKREMCIVELVPDAKSKKEGDAMQQLMDRIEGEEKLTWTEQMKKAVMLHPIKDDDGNIEEVSNGDAIFHFISVFWKVLFSLCPPPHYGGGFPCFMVALFFIGATTLVVKEIATLMGCVMLMKPGVTAITFVAIGTSIPDTFASKIAAQQERYADEAVGNVTGSNSVNVFLGLGLPWVIASIYYSAKGEVFKHPAKGLDLSVALFLVVSLIGIAILIIRRRIVGGELGGSATGRYVSAAVFISLWFIYVIASSLAQYEIIKFSSE